MPEFHLETSGVIVMHKPAFAYLQWSDLDAFAQGYIEALFFTSEAPGVSTDEWQATEEHAEGSIPCDVGFSDLAPDALATILEDCLAFKVAAVHVQPLMGSHGYPDEAQAGRDFWYTRNGHGCGFWDGDWPEPHDEDLTQASKAFREGSPYLGDDGLVYLDWRSVVGRLLSGVALVLSASALCQDL